jgi:hypothetical protein
VRSPDIELLWWEGCPSTDRALEELHGVLDDLGLSRETVRMLEVKTDEDARRLGFIGSPTVLIDGHDAVTVAPEEVGGLACRVYRRRDGAVSPTPDPDDLRQALRRAAEREEAA